MESVTDNESSKSGPDIFGFMLTVCKQEQSNWLTRA